MRKLIVCGIDHYVSNGVSVNNKLFQPSDLYWSLVWLMNKIYYSALPIHVLIKFARLKGRLKAFSSEKRDLAEKNLLAVFGDTRTEGEIRAILRRHSEYLKEYELTFRLPNLKRFSKSKLLPMEGIQHLDSALSRGKGVILLITHFGYGRLIKHFIRMKGYKVWVLGARSSKRMKAEKRETKRVNEMTAFRRFAYHRLRVSADVTDDRDFLAGLNVRPLVKVLKKNGILVINGDAQQAANFANLPFLGQTYPFPTGFMKIAMGTGALILPAFAVDTPEGFGIKVVIEEPLALEKSGTSDLELKMNMRRFVDVFETYVKTYPYLYKIWAKENWFEKRLARSKKVLVKRY